MIFSIRLTEEEKSLAESYAKIHSISLEEDDAGQREIWLQVSWR